MYHNPNKLTLQEIFDISCKTIIGQDGYSMREDYCAYRGENGRMCAAGPFIPEENVKECEGNGAGDVFADILPETCRPNAHARELLRLLQRAHDNAAREYTSMHEWAEDVKWMVRHLGLSTTVLDKLLEAK